MHAFLLLQYELLNLLFFSIGFNLRSNMHLHQHYRLHSQKQTTLTQFILVSIFPQVFLVNLILLCMNQFRQKVFTTFTVFHCLINNLITPSRDEKITNGIAWEVRRDEVSKIGEEKNEFYHLYYVWHKHYEGTYVCMGKFFYFLFILSGNK